MVNTKTLIEEAVHILREDLTYTLWDEYGIKVLDSENYVDMAVDSLVDEVWFEGHHLYQDCCQKALPFRTGMNNHN